MKLKITKIVSLLICVCMIISGMVISASAAEQTATLSFADKAQRKSFSSTQQVWEQNGITFTNNKSSSTTAVADYAAPVRLYANSQIIVELASGTIKTIVFNANTTGYATALKNSIGSAATASSKTVTVTGVDNSSFTVAKLTAQVRLDSIVVTYEEATTPDPEEPGQGSGETPDPDPEPDPEPEPTPDPTPDTELTVEAAATLGASKEHDAYTEGKYYVTGIVASIDNADYGNMTIKDAADETKTLYVYGSYSKDGQTAYKDMEVKHEAGDTVKIYGVIGQYNGKAQMKNAWVDLINDVNPPVTPDPEEPGEGGGETPDPEEPAGNTATITFDDTSKRTEYSDTKQVWVENGITVTNNKGSSTTKVGNYADPVRFYKNSEVIIAYPGMTKVVISAPTSDSGKYATPWGATVSDPEVTPTVDGGTYTFVFDSPIDTLTFASLSGQARADSITVTYAATEPETPSVPSIDESQVDVNEDLSLNQSVTVKPEDVEGKKIEMQFTMNGVTTKVSYDASQIVNDKLIFTFDNIGIQCMADDIAMKLVTVDANNNEEVVQEETFSVKTYAESILKVTTDENTKVFVSNMLHYGAAAQKYLYPDIADTELANYGVEGIVDAGNVEVPTEEKMSLTDNASAGDVYFKGATVRFDNTNTLVIKLNAKTENTKVLVNGAEATLNGLECVITGLKATDYATKFTFELYEGDLLVQTLSYGINSYAFSKQTSTNGSMAALAKALYAYGASASTPAN